MASIRVNRNRASAGRKVDCGNETNWLLLDPADSRNLHIKTGGIMKKPIITLACLLIAPVAFAQTHSKRESRATTTTEQPITVTGTTVETTEGGSAANYQPSKTLVVNKNTPGRYVLDGPGHVVNRKGEVVRTAIKPGTRVRVYYVGTGTSRTVDRVVVD